MDEQKGIKKGNLCAVSGTPFTQHTLTHLRAVPVSADAAHAEAVAARCGRRVGEHIEAD